MSADQQNMPGTGQYNNCSTTIRRIKAEYRALEKEPEALFHAEPLGDNIFEWHFSFRGPPKSVYEGGIYHGKIILPLEYPFKPPTVVLLSPTGRWQENTKICLSATGFHPELWQPSWSIKTLILAIIGFMETPGDGAIGAIEMSDAQRREIAAQSRSWKCSVCGMDHSNSSLFPTVSSESSPVSSTVSEESVATSLASHLPARMDVEEGRTTSSHSPLTAGASVDEGLSSYEPVKKKNPPIDARTMLMRMREKRKKAQKPKEPESEEIHADESTAAATEAGTETVMSDKDKLARARKLQLLDLVIALCLIIIIGILTRRFVLSSTGANTGTGGNK